MKFRLLLSILTVLVSLVKLSGQSYLNSETNTYYLFNRMLSPDTYDYSIIKKLPNRLPTINSVIWDKQTKLKAVDSLKKIGFEEKFDLYDLSKVFTYTFHITNYTFFMNNSTDSLYKVSVAIKLKNKKGEESTLDCGVFITKYTQSEINEKFKSIAVKLRRLGTSSLYFLTFCPDTFTSLPIDNSTRITPSVAKVYF